MVGSSATPGDILLLMSGSKSETVMFPFYSPAHHQTSTLTCTLGASLTPCMK